MTRRTNKKRSKKGGSGSGSPLIRESATIRNNDKLGLLQGSPYLSPPSSPQSSKTYLLNQADIQMGFANSMMNDLVREKANKGREACYKYCNKEEKDYIQRELERYNINHINQSMHDNELTWSGHITRNEGIAEKNELFERLRPRNSPHSGRKSTNSRRLFGSLFGGKKTRKGRKRRRRRKTRRYNKKY